MLDTLHRRYTGPVPRPQRRAAEAGDAGAWRARAAARQAAALGDLCRATAAAIAQSRQAPEVTRSPRLGLLCRRLRTLRQHAVAWRESVAAGSPRAS